MDELVSFGILRLLKIQKFVQNVFSYLIHVLETNLRLQKQKVRKKIF
jgi:hypothetical protein